MQSAPVVIVATICALIVIYFLPSITGAGRKAYGRYRRRMRTLRQERDGRPQTPKRAYRQ